MPAKYLPILIYLQSETERDALNALAAVTGESVSNLARRALAQQFALELPPMVRGAPRGNQRARKKSVNLTDKKSEKK